jgi:hypothetical protein
MGTRESPPNGSIPRYKFEGSIELYPPAYFLSGTVDSRPWLFPYDSHWSFPSSFRVIVVVGILAEELCFPALETEVVRAPLAPSALRQLVS